MLTHEEAELLVRVGPGTPMGEFFRQYWMPVAMSSELPECDGPPLRVRVLGENLVAYRGTNGAVGLIAEACPHRGASLWFGRNEEAGLRCVYHGWKFDVTGACIDMPNELAESNFKHKIRATAYPCVERGRLVWAYLGPLDPPPPFPRLPFTTVPDDHVLVRKMYEGANWLQNLQGSIDPSHAPFLHGVISDEERARRMAARSFHADYHMRQQGWRFESVETPMGLMVAGRLSVEGDQYYWRVNILLLPFYTLVGNDWGEDPLANIQAFVPIDDEHTMSYTAVWHPTHPLPVHLLADPTRGATVPGFAPRDPTRTGSEWLPEANEHNDYMLDRHKQRTETLTGLPSIAAQDQAVIESQGPLGYHTKEHLGTTDGAIISARRTYMRAARALREHGALPVGVLDTDEYQVRAPAKVLPRSVTNWVVALRDYYNLRPGVNLPMP